MQDKAEHLTRARFGWWGAEEIGLLGSRHYVDELVKCPEAYDKLVAYFNYDMEAGPNYVRFVYDANTVPSPSAREGSKILQTLLEDHFDYHELTTALTPMNGGSDHYPFVLAGIPAGGLATGASGLLTLEDRLIHGGVANAPNDPCCHAPCDTLENINT